MNEQPTNSRSSIPGWVWVLGIFGLIFGLQLYFTGRLQGPEQVSIQEMMDLIRQNKVQSAEIIGERIEVTLIEGETINDSDVVATVKHTSDSLAETFEFYGITPENLERIDLIVRDQSTRDTLISILFTVGPILLLIWIFTRGFRRMQGGGNNDIIDFGRSRARNISHAERPTVTFDDVGGCEEVKRELQEIIQFLREPGKFVRFGARIPKGVLLAGLPGTGKTLLAKAVASEAGVPFFSIAGSEFVEMLVGVGASRVRDLFEQAKLQAPCIVFVDEIDAIGRQRTSTMLASHPEHDQTLNQILVEMDGFGTDTRVIMMAATNRVDMLDPALIRPGRFDKRVHIPLPNYEERIAILKIHMRGKPISTWVDIARIARDTVGMSGADLETIVNEAAILAAKSGTVSVIDQTFFEAAAQKVGVAIPDPKKPDDVIRALDQWVIGQEHAKRILAVTAVMHYGYVRRNFEGQNAIGIKPNVLLIGPKGTGKTLLAQSLARYLHVPFAVADAPTIVASQLMPTNSNQPTVLRELLQASENNVQKAQYGIICIQNIDKLASEDAASLNEHLQQTEELKTEEMQQVGSMLRAITFLANRSQEMILRFLKGVKVEVTPSLENSNYKRMEINTQNILFICEGEFPGLEDKISRRLSNAEKLSRSEIISHVQPQDLISYGLAPSLVQSLSMVAVLDELQGRGFQTILNSQWDGSLLEEYEQLLQTQNITAHFPENGKKQIVAEALSRGSDVREIGTVVQDTYLHVLDSLAQLDSISIDHLFIQKALAQKAKFNHRHPTINTIEISQKYGLIVEWEPSEKDHSLVLLQYDTSLSEAGLKALFRIVDSLITRNSLYFIGVPAKLGPIHQSEDLPLDCPLRSMDDDLLSHIRTKNAILYGFGDHQFIDKNRQLKVSINQVQEDTHEYLASAFSLLTQLHAQYPYPEAIYYLNKLSSMLKQGHLDVLPSFILLQVMAKEMGIELPMNRHPSLHKLFQGQAKLLKVSLDTLECELTNIDAASLPEEYAMTNILMWRTNLMDLVNTPALTGLVDLLTAYHWCVEESKHQPNQKRLVRTKELFEALEAGKYSALDANQFLLLRNQYLLLRRKMENPALKSTVEKFLALCPHGADFLLGIDHYTGALAMGAEVACHEFVHTMKSWLFDEDQGEQQTIDYWFQMVNDLENLLSLDQSKWNWFHWHNDFNFYSEDFVEELIDTFPESEVPTTLKDGMPMIDDVVGESRAFYESVQAQAVAVFDRMQAQMLVERCQTGCLILNEFEIQVVKRLCHEKRTPYLVMIPNVIELLNGQQQSVFNA